MPSAPQTFPGIARAIAAVIALVALGSVALQIGLNLWDGTSLVEVLTRMTRFFTILTNVLVGLTFIAVALGKPVGARWLLAMAAAIAGVGLVYHALLAHLLVQVGWGILANHGVHTAAPILTVLWFLAFAPADAIKWRDALLVIPWPSLYCFYALARGVITGDYPYPFIDWNSISTGQLVVNIAGLTLFFALLGVALIAGLRMRARMIAA